jgi:7,8-dihydro-6-hydroxymethylpterin dimethyltransferase
MDGSIRKATPYIFYGQTTSLCETCMALVPAKIIIEDGKVFYLKRCKVHGVQKSLISTDPTYSKPAPIWAAPMIAGCARTTSSIPVLP